MRRRDTGVRPTIIGATAVAAALLAALAACSGSTTATGKASATARVSTSPVSAPRNPKPTASESPTPTPTPPARPKPSALPVGPPNVGELPQTNALPKANGTAFNSAVHDLWLALTTGDANYAKPAFFPEKAYEQVKAIADPEADWQGRLWLDFTLDLAAAHKLVKPGATLVKVTTPTQYEQWIPVGACYNGTGYWHLPGSRLVWRQGGVTQSFGIASFISWRGDWYLIHLGALVRSGAYGIVDDPETGEGSPGPAGGC